MKPGLATSTADRKGAERIWFARALAMDMGSIRAERAMRIAALVEKSPWSGF